ncbi:hypothetical protein C1H76_2452 [Elsinoe australis]|uniref:Uncharacterized protein n=1 Tax=Elsinoe australis TaxID=40998 RepID=A0A4U7B7A5_9PEZI|nr:hypothetical protein C1H76_2452 [Elsinoe australis]
MKTSFLLLASTLLSAFAFAQPIEDSDLASVDDATYFSSLVKRQGQCLTRPRRQAPPTAQSRTINFLNPEPFAVEGVQVTPTRIRRGRYRVHFTTSLANIQRRTIFFFPPSPARTTTGGELDVVSMARGCTDTEITYDYDNPDGSEDSVFDVWVLNTS